MSPRLSTLICLLGLPALSGSPLAPPEAVDVAAVEDVALPGDVVFRRGRSLLSRVVLTGDDDPDYSHVGIVADLDGELVVVHATPGGNMDAPEPVRMEPLAMFYAPEAAEAGALRRPLDAERAAGAARAALRLARGRAFDADLDLDSDDLLYCTELVWKAYREVGIDLTDGQFDYATDVLHEGPMVFPSTLLHSPSLSPLPGLSL